MVVRCSSLIFIICFFLLSCQTTQKVAIKEGSVTPEQEYARKKIREWEEYMSLLEYGDASIETVLRLSDEYFMAKEVLHEREMEDYELKRQFYQLDKIKSEPEEPLPDYALPVKYFKKLANEYRYGAGADALRYILAYSLYEDGKLNEAVPLYESLLTNFPESDYRMETTFRLAEFYFETGQYGEAIDKYNGILRDLNSGFYEQSLYKLGWAYYKTGEFENSVDSFISILDRRWDGEFKKGGLMEEAASSMTMALNHFKDMGQVINYLKSKGLRDYTPSIVKRLAERISEEGRYAEAVSAYRGFMHLFPDAVDIPFVYEEISRLYEFIDDEENSLKTREELVLLFNPKSGRYRRIYPKGSEPVDKLVWMVIMLGVRETGGNTAFPGYGAIAKMANVSSRSTIARAIAILRATRWLTLCGRMRKASGRFRGNVYALHDEPLPLADATHLDGGYMAFLNNAVSHGHARVRTVARGVLASIDEDIQGGRNVCAWHRL